MREPIVEDPYCHRNFATDYTDYADSIRIIRVIPRLDGTGLLV